MTEAERYLENKRRKEGEDTNARLKPVEDAAPKREAPTEAPAAVESSVPINVSPAKSASGANKCWGAAMGVFAIVMTMLWMAVFKGGCR